MPILTALRHSLPKRLAMKKKDLEKFKKLLDDDKARIIKHLEQLEEHAEHDLDNTAGVGDQLDLAALEMSQASIQKIGKREQSLLNKINLALKKIEDGTYGECEECGEEISPARLQAPSGRLSLCISIAKTLQEKQEKKFSSRDGTEDSSDDEIGRRGLRGVTPRFLWIYSKKLCLTSI